jgi:L-iditol 2-dehydrogenase
VPALNVERDVLKLPPDLPLAQATLIEPIATCIRGIQRAGIQAGDTVAVIGAGVIGLIHAQLARLAGALMVVVSDFTGFRLEMARQFGADHAIDAREDVLTVLKELNQGRGADVVIVTAGNVEAMEQGMALAGAGATVLLFAPTSPKDILTIEPHRVFFSEITLTTSYSSSPQETRQALQLILGSRIEAEKLITHRFDLAGVGEAIELAAQAEESLKIVITS